MRIPVRLCTAVVLTLAATLLAPAAANAFAIGAGRFAHPGLAVDAAGTAYIAWNGQDNAQNVAPLHFCRLPRGATACDAGAAGAIATLGASLSRPFIVVSGERVVVVQYRYGAGVPGTSQILAFTSTDRGVTFGPGRAIGSVVFEEAVVGPADTISGLPLNAEMNFQSSPLDGTAPVNADGISTVPKATLSTTHVNHGTVGLLDANTPLAVLTSNANAQYRRYTGSGSVNDAASWTPAVDIGYAYYPRLAGGPSGLFLLASTETGIIFAREWNGAVGNFAAPVPIGLGNAPSTHLFQDAAGRLHAAFMRGDAAGRHLVHAVSDDGTTWRSGTVVTTTSASDDFIDTRIATAPDHVGVAVWVGEGHEVRVAGVGPDAPARAIPPPPVVVPQPVKPKPSVTATGSARLRGGLVRVKVGGKLGLRGGVTRAAGCKGTVKVSVKRGRRVLASKSVAVKPTCAFTFSATVRRSRVGRATKLALRIRFTGNDALAAVTKVGSIKIRR